MRATAKQTAAERAAQRAADRLLLGEAVKAYGGYSGLARQLGLALTTVHGWRCRESIPPWRIEAIRRLPKLRELRTTRQGQGTRKRVSLRAA